MNLFDVMTGTVSRMNHVTRYSSFPVNRRENVAEHSWWVCFVAYLLVYDLSHQGYQVDMGMTLRQCVVHDLSEVVSGDVIRSYKHTNAAVLAAMKQADEINMSDLLSGEAFENIMLRVKRDITYAKADTTLEGQIVEFADMAVVIFYCREEDRSGNRAIRYVLKQAYEEWFSKFHTHHCLGQYIEQIFPEGRFFDALREEMLPAKRMFGREPEQRLPERDGYARAFEPKRTTLPHLTALSERLEEERHELPEYHPIMHDHSEGAVSEHAWPTEEPGLRGYPVNGIWPRNDNG